MGCPPIRLRAGIRKQVGTCDRSYWQLGVEVSPCLRGVSDGEARRGRVTPLARAPRSKAGPWIFVAARTAVVDVDVGQGTSPEWGSSRSDGCSWGSGRSDGCSFCSRSRLRQQILFRQRRKEKSNVGVWKLSKRYRKKYICIFFSSFEVTRDKL